MLLMFNFTGSTFRLLPEIHSFGDDGHRMVMINWLWMQVIWFNRKSGIAFIEWTHARARVFEEKERR